MTVHDTIKSLVTAKNYLEVRINVDDSFIEFVKENLKRDYEYFRVREEAYQILKKIGRMKSKEPCYPSKFRAVLVHELLIQKARRHLNYYDRRAQIKAFRIFWTKREDNSIADLYNSKNKN